MILLLLVNLMILIKNRSKIWGWFFLRKQFWKCLFLGSNFERVWCRAIFLKKIFEDEIWKCIFWGNNFLKRFFGIFFLMEQFWKCIFWGRSFKKCIVSRSSFENIFWGSNILTKNYENAFCFCKFLRHYLECIFWRNSFGNVFLREEFQGKHFWKYFDKYLS